MQHDGSKISKITDILYHNTIDYQYMEIQDLSSKYVFVRVSPTNDIITDLSATLINNSGNDMSHKIKRVFLMVDNYEVPMPYPIVYNTKLPLFVAIELDSDTDVTCNISIKANYLFIYGINKEILTKCGSFK